MKDALEEAGFKAEVGRSHHEAATEIEFTGDDALKMQKLLDALENLDDVQEVYTNAADRRVSSRRSRARAFYEDSGRRFRRPRTCAGLEAGPIARVQIVYVAPGNGGTAQDERLGNVDITDPAALADFVEREHIALTWSGRKRRSRPASSTCSARAA